MNNRTDAKLQKNNIIQNKIKFKILTQYMVDSLQKINEFDELKKGYKHTIFCNSIINITDNKITSRYCKNRWCLSCLRIRTAKLINDYTPIFFKDENTKIYYLTLTRTNVDADILEDEIKNVLLKKWKHIKDLCRKEFKNIDYKGIRKIESTYNINLNNYHPHLHLIVDKLEVALFILDKWLKSNGLNSEFVKSQTFKEYQNQHLNYNKSEIYDVARGCSFRSQIITQWDKNNLIELFKYETKFLYKGVYYAEPLNLIFFSLLGVRTFQSFGKIKKELDENDYELEAVNFAEQNNLSGDYVFNKYVENNQVIGHYFKSKLAYLNINTPYKYQALYKNRKIDLENRIEQLEYITTKKDLETIKSFNENKI